MVEHEMDLRFEFRYNKEIKEKIDFLLKKDANLESIAHLIRVAITRMHNEEVKNNANKGFTTSRD